MEINTRLGTRVKTGLCIRIKKLKCWSARDNLRVGSSFIMRTDNKSTCKTSTGSQTFLKKACLIMYMCCFGVHALVIFLRDAPS